MSLALDLSMPGSNAGKIGLRAAPAVLCLDYVTGVTGPAFCEGPGR